MCTSISAGRGATDGAVTLISRNEDCLRGNWNKYLMARPEPEYVVNKDIVVDGAEKDGVWTLGNGMKTTVPKAPHYAYTGAPDAGSAEEASGPIGSRFFYEERGVNEVNFAISATNSLSMNDTAAAVDPLLPHCLAEAIIPTLLLPQAKSASHAVDLLGGYMAANGASEANGVLLSDPEEVWYFEIGSHSHWIAVRIPDDKYLVVANQMRVHGVDLNSPDVRHSPGLVEFVTDCGLLAEPDPANFNFAAAFGALGDPYNTNREWLAQYLLTPSLDQPIGEAQYPLFLAPDAPIAPHDVMEVLTAVYEGTPFMGKLAARKADGLPCKGFGERPIGYWKTGESHIITLDKARPAALQGVIWQAISTPLCAPYVPLPAAMTATPHCYRTGDDGFGAISAYWANRSLYTLAKTAGDEALSDERVAWRGYERDLIAEWNAVSPAMAAMAEHDLKGAKRFAQHYGAGVALAATERAVTRRNLLMTTLANTD